jgi:hypothetical protein
MEKTGQKSQKVPSQNSAKTSEPEDLDLTAILKAGLEDAFVRRLVKQMKDEHEEFSRRKAIASNQPPAPPKAPPVELRPQRKKVLDFKPRPKS